MKNYSTLKAFTICTLMLIGSFTIAQEKLQVTPKTVDCCNAVGGVLMEYTPKIPVKDIEDDMMVLSKNDIRVERLIDADTIWYREIKEGNFRTEKPNRFVTQNVPYDEVRYVQIDDKIYYQFFVSKENLIKKYNPKDIDFSIYRGYILWEAQKDITYVAEQFNDIDEIARVEIISQYFIKVFAPIEYVISTFGEDYLDPEDGEYPGYFTHLRLRTAPYLPLKSKFSDQLPEDKEYRTPYMRVFNLETGDKQATITMRPNAYPLLPVGFMGNYEGLPSEIRKNLMWVDIPTNEPIRQDVINIIHPKSGAKDAISDAIGVQIYLNAIEVDNDGSSPLNWVIEAWESNYYIQVGAMRDDAGILRNHNYARMLDKFDISAINDATNITSVEYETFIANTNPTCWEAWYGGCDCIVNYNEIGPKSYNITNNITSANNTKLGGEKDFNSKTWYDDTYDGDVYYTDPSWNWDKGDGYTNYDVVYNVAGITDFEGRLAGDWYVVGIKDKTEDDNNSTWWQGIETLNAFSSLRITFIPICGDTDLGSITPTSCTWQEAPYNSGTRPYWKFYASSSYNYNFTLCSNSEDSYIRIYDSFNNQVAYNDDNGPFCSGFASSSSISWSPTTSGTYYISAARYSCNTMNNSGTMYYSRSDDPWMRKGTITPTTSWQTSANTVGEINFWTFEATAGTTYAFNFCDIVEDTYIRIFDNTWTQQDYNDDNGPCCSGSASSTVWTCPTSGTYYIAGMHWSCRAFTTSGNLNYSISLPIASATVTNNTICAGESTTLQGSGTAVCGTIAQYDWAHLAETNNPQNPVVSPTSNTNYQLRVLDSNGIWSDWVSVSVVVYTPPTAPTSVSGTTTICNGYGTNVTLSATGGSSGSGSTYQWYANGCGSGSVLGAGASLTVSPSITTTYYVRSVGTVACSSTFTTCANGTVTVNTPPTAPTGITNAGLTICEGASINLSATGGSSGSGCTYQWYANGCGSSSVLGTGSSLTVSPSTTTTYYVRSVGTAACSSTFTTCANGTIYVDPLPTASAGGSQIICSNGSVTVGGASASNGTILWTHNGYGTITDETAVLATYHAVSADENNTVILTMIVTSNNACNPQTAQATYTVNIEPLPIASAGGSQSICSNGTATVSGATASNGTILWTENGAGSITAGATTLTPTYTAASSDAGNTVILTMTVTSNNACSPQTATATYTVNVDPLPTATAGGSATICPGDMHIVSGANSEYGINSWSHDGNGSLSNETTLNPTYASVPADEGNPITLTLTVTSNNTCNPETAQAIYTINVSSLPTAPVIVNSDINSFCEDDAGNIILSATGGYGTSTRWFDDVCGGNEIGTDNPLSFPSPVVTTTYYARNENTCGVSDCTSKTITVVGQPTVPDEALSNINIFCADHSDNIELSVNGGSGESVQWFTGLCGGTSVGTGNPLIIPSPDVTTEYFARWTNVCGESDCVSVVVTVNPLPVTPTSASVDRTDFCSDDTGVIELSVTGGSGDAVHWYTGSCGGTAAGIGNPLSIDSPTENTVYYARWENSCDVTVCQNITVTVISSGNATINPVGPFCEDTKPITLTAAQDGGAWSGNGITDASAGVFNPVFAGIGDHIITYTISGECGDFDQITINVIENFDASITSGLSFCYRDSTALLTAASVGGTWEGADVIVLGDETYLNMIDIDPGNYEIIYHYDGLCGDADTVNITIHPLVDATITPVDTLTDQDNPVQLVAAQDGGVWNGFFVDVLGVFNPQEAGAAEHQVIYTIDGLCGDADTTKIIVIIAPISDLLVPTVITPNNDGYNDTWNIQGIETYENVSINIFTRWGDEVFTYNGSGENYANILNQWDGRKKNKKLPTGSYLYVLIIEDNDVYKGTISLIW